MTTSIQARRLFKELLAFVPDGSEQHGVTLLTYHRVGGGTDDEMDLDPSAFERQMEMIQDREVISIDEAVGRLNDGDARPALVITFDDGFDEIYSNAFPVLQKYNYPFTIYLASAYVGRPMVWEGATARGEAGVGLSWQQLREMVDSGLCTVGNHTHNHSRPEHFLEEELDRCNEVVVSELGTVPSHFAFPWGEGSHEMNSAIRSRFRSAATTDPGRNTLPADVKQLKRVSVRLSDGDKFFEAKLDGHLRAERMYEATVRGAKTVVRRARGALRAAGEKISSARTQQGEEEK